MFEVGPKNSKTKHFFSQVWTCVTSLTKTKTSLPVGRMLSLGPWPRVLPKPYETMFNMHKNKRLLWGVHDQKRARPRTRKEQPRSKVIATATAHVQTCQNMSGYDLTNISKKQKSNMSVDLLKQDQKLLQQQRCMLKHAKTCQDTTCQTYQRNRNQTCQ